MGNKLKEILLFKPHNMLISGVTNCGKTHFVLDLIENYYLKMFEFIVIFCPTYFMNKTYERSWVFREKNVVILNPESVKNHLDETLKIATAVYKGTNTLFIIDDCANLQDSKKKVSELCHLAFSARHYGITVWVINQKYNSVVKDFRENTRLLILFYNADEKSMKLAFEENSIIPKEKRQGVIDHLRTKKSGKLIIRKEHPREFLVI